MAFSHNLLNQRIKPKDDALKAGCWKGKPNLNNDHFGTIRAVDHDPKFGTTNFMVEDPYGNLFTVGADMVTLI